ncbi:MAG: hypothetical protein ACREBE_07875, partial [bacterium]
LQGAAIALACVVGVDALTNAIAPSAQFDSLFYVDMAENGVWGNPHLAAPFAFRPLVPLAVHWIAATGVDVETAFYWLARASAVALVFSVWALAFSVARQPVPAAAATLLAALQFHVLKMPLFWHTLVDVEACLVMVWSIHALMLGRRRTSLALACVGLLMKEFLLIPALFALAARARGKPRASRRELLVGSLAVLAAIAVPRLAIPVVKSYQEVDPFHSAHWLRDLAAALGPGRWLRVGFSIVGFGLPAWILVSSARIARLERLGRGRLALGAGYVGGVALFSLLGGSDMARFSAYLLPLLAIVLAVFLADGPDQSSGGARWIEIAIALCATVVFNRLWIEIPDPATQLVGFAEAFCGHGECGGPRLAARCLELAALIGAGSTLATLARRRGMPSS